MVRHIYMSLGFKRLNCSCCQVLGNKSCFVFLFLHFVNKFCTNSRCQFAQVTKFFKVVKGTCFMSPVCGTRILRLLLYFLKIFLHPCCLVVFLFSKAFSIPLQSGRRGRPSFQVSGSGVRTCRFSPDGHLLVTAGDDEKAFIWSTRTMEQLMCVTK